MYFKLKVLNEKDSVLEDGFQYPAPMEYLLQKTPYKGGFEEGLLLLSKGDSATFKINADSLFNESKGRPRPKTIKKGEFLKFTVKVFDLIPSKEFIQKRAKEVKENLATYLAMPNIIKQAAADEKTLQNYFKKNNIMPQKSDIGLYYIIEKEGNGKQIAIGDSATIHYAGSSVSTGKEFDNSKNHGKPFSLVIGMGSVIPGWDFGIPLFKVGTKAKLYIPSYLGYGERGNMPKISPNENLIFDIEIVK